MARKYDILLICDDVYDLLYYGKGDSLPAKLVTLDHSEGRTNWGNVLSNGSFSKVIGPGLRCGWVEASPRVIRYLSQHAATKSGGAPSQLTAYAISEFIQTDVCERHIETLRRVYEERAESYYAYIQNYLYSFGVTARKPAGGYFIWLTLPSDLGMTAQDFVAVAESKYNVRLFPGEMCDVRSKGQRYHTWSNAIRISVSYTELDEGLLGLEQVYKAIVAVLQC